ncbi:YdbH domain-containing protein [Photobacterium sp. R1]
MSSDNHAAGKQIRTRLYLRRIRRGFLLTVTISACLITVIALLTTFWLTAQGIQLHAISGIGVSQHGLSVKLLTINIHETKIELSHVLLSKQNPSREDRTLSDSAQERWRIEAKQMKLRPSPQFRTQLRQMNLNGKDAMLEQVSFVSQGALTQGRFLFHANSAETQFHTLTSDTGYRQRLQDIQIEVATSPDFRISGHLGRGVMNLPVPAANQTEKYPADFQDLNFSYQKTETTQPFHMSVKQITPGQTENQETTDEGIDQLSITLDLASPANSLTANAKRIDWNPSFLLSRQPASETPFQPRLGQLAVLLYQLPAQKIDVDLLTIRGYLSHAQLSLNKAQEGTHFSLKGMLNAGVTNALPFDIRFLASANQAASFSLRLLDASGADKTQPPLLACDANWQFSSDIPQQIACTSDNVTKIMHKFNISDIHVEDSKTQTLSVKAERIHSEHTQTQATQTSEPFDWHYQIEVQGPEHIAFTWPDGTPSKKANRREQDPARIDMTHDGTWRWELQLNSEQALMSLAAQEQLALSSKSPDVQTQIDLTALTCHIPYPEPSNNWLNTLNCEAGSTVTATTPLLQIGPVTAQSIEMSQRIQAQIKTNVLQMTISDLKAHAERITLPDTAEHQNNILNQPEFSASEIRLTSPLTEQAPLTSWHIETEQLPLELNADFSSTHPVEPKQTTRRTRQPVQHATGNLTLTLNRLRAELTRDQWAFNSEYEAGLTFSLNAQPFPAVRSHGSLTASPDQIGVTGRFSTAKSSPILHFRITSAIPTGKTRFQIFPQRLTFSGKQSLQKFYLPQLPARLDLNNGNLTVIADLTLDNQLWSGSLDVFTEHLNGRFKDVHFADLNLSFTSLIYNNTIRSRHPLTVHNGWLFAGTLFQDITLNGEFDTRKPDYALHRASARVLGGYLSTQGVTSHSLTNIDVIPLRIQRLSLKKLMDLFNAKDVELTGLLDGMLPIQIEDGKPVIKKGTLFSRSPGGILRYKQESSIGKNIESGNTNSLKVIAGILRNYQYDSLAIDIDYSKDGQLNASSRFKGHNPDFLHGRPVNINLNIQDDIPALIKTLNTINASEFERMFVKQLGLEK